MPEEFSDHDTAAEVQREAVVEMANLTNGMMGGMFDRSRDAGEEHMPSPSRLTPAGRVRVVSGMAAIGLAVLAVLSPVLLALTVGTHWSVTVVLGVAAAVAGIVHVVSFTAERRAIGRRSARDLDH